MKVIGKLFGVDLVLNTDDPLIIDMAEKAIKNAFGPCPICKEREEQLIKGLKDTW